MQVQIPEKLLFDMIDLLVEPQSLRPNEGTCVLSLEARNQVLDRLLQIRHSFLFDSPPASAKVSTAVKRQVVKLSPLP